MEYREMSIEEKIKHALTTEKWMLRRSNGGKSYNDFQWNPVGEWTEAPDWDPSPRCGGGLHGNGPKSIGGYYTAGVDIDFCFIDEPIVTIDEKIKVRRAMILSRNSLPEGLQVGGNLDLRGTQITSLPEGLQVGGYLDLQDTQITSLPEGLWE